jgi:hypothetical protein
MDERVVLHVIIPGKPYAQKRHRWGRGRVYDPSAPDKEAFLWELKAACPKLRPDLHSRIGVFLKVRTDSWVEDSDNYLKFYLDAMSPTRRKKRSKKRPDYSQAFAPWGNDNQVDDARIQCIRGVIDQSVEILVWRLHEPQPQENRAENALAVADEHQDAGVHLLRGEGHSIV